MDSFYVSMTIACICKRFTADITDIRHVHSKTVTYRMRIILLFVSIYALYLYSHTVIQSYSHTVIYSHAVMQSYSHTVIQSYSHTVIVIVMTGEFLDVSTRNLIVLDDFMTK